MAYYKGGCQCGNIIFEIEGELGEASICHCLMCQTAFANYFAPLVELGSANLKWVNEEPSYFQSSNFARRGFCKNCGTQLSYEAPDGISIAIGAFDNCGNIKPTIQYGIESIRPVFKSLAKLPQKHTLDDLKNAKFLCEIVSYQRKHSDS